MKLVMLAIAALAFAACAEHGSRPGPVPMDAAELVPPVMIIDAPTDAGCVECAGWPPNACYCW